MTLNREKQIDQTNANQIDTRFKHNMNNHIKCKCSKDKSLKAKIINLDDKRVRFNYLLPIVSESGPLEKGKANHFSILALRTPEKAKIQDTER